MSKAPLVVIGAGGTGGHMFPASAFAAEMKKRGWRVGLMTDERGLVYRWISSGLDHECESRNLCQQTP